MRIATLGYRMALPFALFLGVGEIVVNWGNWSFWPFWLVDYIAVALLLWGWNTTRRQEASGTARLAGAWGFTCAMFYMAFFGHLQSLGQPDHGPIDNQALTPIIGILFALTVVGFLASLVATKQPLPRHDR